MSDVTQKWFDLCDRQSGAKLKLRRVNGSNFLFVAGISKNSPRWAAAVEKLGFRPDPSARFLLRMVQHDERIKLSWLRQVWPDAVNAMMTLEQIGLQVSGQGARSASSSELDESRSIAMALEQARRLGRNYEGDEVYEGGAGRFIHKPGKGVVHAVDGLPSPLFLQAADDASLLLCAEGMVRSMEMGEAQRSEELLRLAQAIFGEDVPSVKSVDRVHAALDAALVSHLVRRHDTAQDAFGDAGRLYAYLPPYLGSGRGAGSMPVPLSIVAQRLLGDTSEQVVLYPNAFDGASFSFLPTQTKIRAFRGSKDLSALAPDDGRVVEWFDDFNSARETGLDAVFFNADPRVDADGVRLDYLDALNSLKGLKPGGRAVFVLAGEEALEPGKISVQSGRFLDSLYARFDVEEVFEVGAELTQRVGTGRSLRVVALRNAPARGAKHGPERLRVLHSWDEVKSVVDEAIVRAQVREAESGGVDVDRVAAENVYQCPYTAFSKVGEATTMVPRNLLAPMMAALSDVQSRYGDVDRFVEAELGFGENTLGDRLSPEQVDALALILARFKSGRGAILADETGIGKGRTLASLATWANKQGRSVVFVTDRANLFSDLARDLRDIGEWGRFRPFITNADGVIVDSVGDGSVLVEGVPTATMREVLDGNKGLESMGCNILFTTYSQISGEDSEKAIWVKNQLAGSLLIVDEAHLAAGSDSNVARQVSEMTQMAGDVIFSSATWAKTPKNLHVFARALPETINVAALSETMRRGGESVAEIFSGMLVRDGALIRREHDLSKLEFVVEIDHANSERNNEIADRIAEVMGQISFVAGDLEKMMFQISQGQLEALRRARNARVEMLRVNVFKSGFGAGSMLYQVQRRLNAALNVDNAIRLALSAIESGCKPGIIFEDTAESYVQEIIDAQTQTLASGETIAPEFIKAPTVRDLMRKIVRDMSTVKVAAVDVDDLEALEGGYAVGQDALPSDDDEVVISDLLSQGRQVNAPEPLDDDVQAIRKPRKRRAIRFDRVFYEDAKGLSDAQKQDVRDGLAQIESLIDGLPEMPINVPDIIAERLTQAGLRVGEISGRKYALRSQDGGGLSKIVRRPKKKSFVTSTVRAYNSGDLDVILLNRSAATGISLHSSPRFADRRRRYVIEMQIPEDPTNRIQLYGRFNRFDQESFPVIALASTGIYGEIRHLMMQNKKLFAMSANVRSSRENFAEIKDVPDLLTSVGREVCGHFLRDNPAIASRMCIDMRKLEDGVLDPAHYLTQRVALLRVKEQRLVYEQVIAMYEDAIMRAELAGENPLKPKDHDWRAETVHESVLFGVDMPGLASAFDGAVYAKTLVYKEHLSPFSWSDVRQMVRASRARLQASGRVKVVESKGGGMPDIDLEPLVVATARQLGALSLTALAATSFKNVDEAMADVKPNPVTRGMMRKQWIESNLGKMLPGARLSLPHPLDERFQRQSVIVDLVPPPPKKESQLAQWRVMTIAPGERSPIAYSLSSLLEGLRRVPIPGTSQSYLATEMVIGADLMSGAGEGDRGSLEEMTRLAFENAPRGERTRRVTVLGGNMYLASEFASEAKIGHGIVYTDERGHRQRGVLVRREFDRSVAYGLPVRLWMPEMMHDFVKRVRMGEANGGVAEVFTTFRSAVKPVAGVVDSLLIDAGSIQIGVDKISRRRVMSILRAAQRRIRIDTFGVILPLADEDPGFVSMEDKAKRGDGGNAYVKLLCDTPSRMERAVRMLIDGVGLQIYVPRPRSVLGRLASSCMREFFIKRAESSNGQGVDYAEVRRHLDALSSDEERVGSVGFDLAHDEEDLFYGAEPVSGHEDPAIEADCGDSPELTAQRFA